MNGDPGQSDLLVSNSTSSMNKTVDKSDELPYEIPNCPSNSILLIFLNYPEYYITRLFYSHADKILISKVLPFIVALGLLTNSTFLWTIVRIREMRTITNFYLANLACADLFFIIVSGFNKFYSFIWSSDFDTFVPWNSAAGCALINGFTYITFFGSLCLITLVSIERFLAICYPLKHRMMNDKARTVKMVAGAWLTAICLSALVAPAWGKHVSYCVVWPEKYRERLPLVVNICQSVKDQFPDIASIAQFVPFVVAMGLNTVLYGLVIKRLSQRNIGKADDKSMLQTQAQKVRNAVALMLVINGIAFFLCLSPFQFYQMYSFVMRHGGTPFLTTEQSYVLGWVGRCSALMNSAVNPLIYSATNARYRRALLTAIGCYTGKRKKVDHPKRTSSVTQSTST